MYRGQRSCDRIIILNNTLRKLWEQHIMWTRSFIISTVDNLGDIEFVTKRLLRNPSDFAAVLKNYYGSEKADKFRLYNKCWGIEKYLQKKRAYLLQILYNGIEN